MERLEASLMKVKNLVAIEQLNECVMVCRQPVVIAELMFKQNGRLYKIAKLECFSDCAVFDKTEGEAKDMAEIVEYELKLDKCKGKCS